mgnify:FL=1
MGAENDQSDYDSGDALTDGAQQARDTVNSAIGGANGAIDAAKGAYNTGKAAKHAANTLKDQGFKDGAKTIGKEAGNGIKNGVKNKVNNMAPVRAAKSTVELAKQIQTQGAKKALKNAGKNAAKGVAKTASKALGQFLLKIVGWILGPAALIAILMVIICANTPAMIFNAVGSKFGVDSEQVQEVINGTVNAVESVLSCVNSIFSKALNWYYDVVDGKVVVRSSGEIVTQEEIDKLAEAGDYDGVLEFYADVTQHYLDIAYDDKVTEITNYANQCASIDYGEHCSYSASLTISTIGENPFNSVDYANIMACYSVTDDFATGQLTRYKSKLRNAKFLTYTLERKSSSSYVEKHDKKGKDISYTATTYWDEVTLVPFSTTDIFNVFGTDANATYQKSKTNEALLTNNDGTDDSQVTNEQAYSEYYTTLTNKLNELGFVGGSNVSGSVYGTVLTEDEIEAYLKGLPSGTSKNRKQLIKTALNVVGRIPYNNTGQRSYPYYGWNTHWGEPSGDSDSKHPYKGLDCSGFVQWVYRNALCKKDGSNPDDIYNQMGSTGIITSSSRMKQISKSELKPGDLGCKRTGGSSGGNWNHVGIYMGNNRWVHCSGSAGTVVVSDNYNGFSVFYRPDTAALEKDGYWKDDTMLPFMQDVVSDALPGVSDDKLTIIATTLHGEFGEDNGFRACAEAVYHYARYNKTDMYGAVKYGNGSYLDAYKKLYVTHEWNPNSRRATSGQLKMLNEVMNGTLTHFPSSRYPYPVMYFNTTAVKMDGWRSKGVIVETIRGGNGATVVYFYCTGVTYAGYKKASQ